MPGRSKPPRRARALNSPPRSMSTGTLTSRISQPRRPLLLSVQRTRWLQPCDCALGLETDVPLRTHTNLLKQKENFKNVVATKYLFDSIEKTVTNIRR